MSDRLFTFIASPIHSSLDIGQYVRTSNGSVLQRPWQGRHRYLGTK